VAKVVKLQPAPFAIVQGVPIPGIKPPSVYPFADMQVGDSFYCEASHKLSVRTSAHVYGRKFKVKFVTRSDGSGVRVWRVK
jgi:hypothetical protein